MREAGRPTVMVAHSDEDTRSVLRYWLEGEGYGAAADAGCGSFITRPFEFDLLIALPGRLLHGAASHTGGSAASNEYEHRPSN